MGREDSKGAVRGHDPYGALYLHVPFCAKRCLYCDFHTSAAAPDDPALDEFAESMVLEVRSVAKQGFLDHVRTIYFGGGTPTFLGGKRLVQILYAISLYKVLSSDIEFTIEVNPDSIDERLVSDIWAMGVNRMSIGVQSFDDAVLSTLGRIHDAQAARQAVRCAQTRFDNVSIDLMCGVPGQTIESFEASLAEACELGVRHVSIYPLTIEPGTPFDELVSQGKLSEPDDDFQADCMQLAADVLGKAGMARYEVASYAMPGFECRHNIAYWTGVPYLGLGPSAVTMTQNSQRRMRNQHGMIVEDLDARQMLAEDLMLHMRMSQGISDGLAHEAAQNLEGLPAVLEGLLSDGLVEHVDGAWRPTTRGWLCGNELYGRIFDLAP